jgi:hypothetical protein
MMTAAAAATTATYLLRRFYIFVPTKDILSENLDTKNKSVIDMRVHGDIVLS